MCLKLLVVLLLFVETLSFKEKDAKSRHFIFNPSKNGEYSFSFETENDINRQEVSRYINGLLQVLGSYSYLTENGQKMTVYYTADENGFQTINEPILIRHPLFANIRLPTRSSGTIVGKNPNNGQNKFVNTLEDLLTDDSTTTKYSELVVT